MIAQKQKEDSENLQGFFEVYGDELKADEDQVKTTDLTDEIDKLMQA